MRSETNLVTADIPTTDARRGRPRDARCDQAILDATLELLVGGIGNLSIDAVAARARVGKATIYRRWSTKEALVVEALGSDTVTITTPDTGTLRGDLEHYFHHVLERLADAKGSDVLPHLIEAACYDPVVRESLEHYITRRQTPVREVLSRAIARGELSAEVDVDVMVDLLLGPLMYRRLLSHFPVDQRFIDHVLDLVL